MKSFLKTLLAVLLAQLILFGAAALFVAGKLRDDVEVEDGSVLVQSLDGSIPESDPVGGLPFGPQVLSHTGIIENLEKARHDERIAAVVLRIGSPQIGYGKMGELRERIAQIRAVGKPVWAYTSWLSTRGLYLGSACDSLFLLPAGYVSVRGTAAARPFLAGTLEKLGVEENLHRIEHYKSAAEMMQRRDFSPSARENVEWLLDEFYPAVVSSIEHERGLPPGTLEKAAMSEGVLVPAEALELGLVDGLPYWDEIETALLSVPGVEARKRDRDELPPRPRTIVGGDYTEVERHEAGIDTESKIAVVHAMGMIQGEESGMTFPFGPTMGAATMSRAFREAAEDEDVAAIIFRIDSGGGESSTSWRIQRAMLRAAEQKPVVVSMLDMAGSGGYLICYPCETLVANDLSVVGSIGSISGKFNLRGLYDKLGITWDFVTRGPNALMESDYFDYTEEQWASFKQRHWRDYQDWVADIAHYRNKTSAEIDSVGRGRVFTGRQAHEIGLIDTLGTFDVAVAIAKQRAGIEADEEVEFVHLPVAAGPLEMLRRGGLGAAVLALIEEWSVPLRREESWAIDPNRYW
ncbi:MAG: hypothetical protein GF330_06115 [Candidatus Eisenbacteria bacterium]|nr:hypothetical protein [Candidatus Eisenbacteria bacterium]